MRAWLVLALFSLGGCYLHHERGEDTPVPTRDGGGPPMRDAGLPSTMDAGIPPPPPIDAGLPVFDAQLPDAAVWREDQCITAGLLGPLANGQPCEGGFMCILDCFCSGAWVTCNAGVLQVSGQCREDACAVPGAWTTCEEYFAGSGENGDRCDPRTFTTCERAEGCCTVEAFCYPLDGIVMETTTCAPCP